MYTHIHHVYTSTQYHYLVLNPTLSDIKIITFFCVFEGYNFSCTFNLAVSLYLSQISFQQHILDSYFFNPFKNIYIIIDVFKSLVFDEIIDMIDNHNNFYFVSLNSKLLTSLYLIHLAHNMNLISLLFILLSNQFFFTLFLIYSKYSMNVQIIIFLM